MATEKRLIDVMPFMKTGWHLVRTGKSNEQLASMSLADVPTVDAVEVVRCKDCKHYGDSPYENGDMMCDRWGEWIFPNDDDFCSCGERKDNG